MQLIAGILLLPFLAAVILPLSALSGHAWAFSNRCVGQRGLVIVGMPSSPCTGASATTCTSRMMISEQQLGFFEVLDIEPPPSERRVSLLDYTSSRDGGGDSDSGSDGESTLIDFQTAWDYQKQLLDGHIERLVSGDPDASSFRTDDDDHPNTPADRGSGGKDAIIMLQHRPVYTLGTGSDEKFVTASSGAVPVVRMDRGGEVTYHGPGQITVYPVLDLRSYRQDIHWYMRALEEAVMLAISRCGGGDTGSSSSSSEPPILVAEREDGVTGVWIDDHKVAAVGIKCRRWITQHGLAVNVEESSLSNFGGIVPCGLEGRRVGCLNQFLVARGREPTTVREFAKLMAEALEEVFRIELVDQAPLPPLR